jgi:hypothetical protein
MNQLKKTLQDNNVNLSLENIGGQIASESMPADRTCWTQCTEATCDPSGACISRASCGGQICTGNACTGSYAGGQCATGTPTCGGSACAGNGCGMTSACETFADLGCGGAKVCGGVACSPADPCGPGVGPCANKSGKV